MTKVLSFVTSNYNTAHEVRADLSKSYDEVIVVKQKENGKTVWGIMAATPKKK